MQLWTVWAIDDGSVLSLLRTGREMLDQNSEQRGYSMDVGAGTGKGQDWNPQIDGAGSGF